MAWEAVGDQRVMIAQREGTSESDMIVGMRWWQDLRKYSEKSDRQSNGRCGRSVQVECLSSRVSKCRSSVEAMRERSKCAFHEAWVGGVKAM